VAGNHPKLHAFGDESRSGSLRKTPAIVEGRRGKQSAVRTKSGALKTYEFRSDESNRWLKTRFLFSLRDDRVIHNALLPRIAADRGRNVR
jgi:hypothetical protein